MDGHEDRVIRGALKTLKNFTVKSWAIEITGNERIKNITKIKQERDC